MRYATLAIFIVLASPAMQARSAPQNDRRPVDFNAQIQPILSNSCFKCHGPDDKARKAGLRLDTREGATALRKSGRAAIVPGDAAAGMLLERVTAEDPKHRMPPEETGVVLELRETELLRRWISEGAKYTRHWSFEPPRRTEPPSTKLSNWVQNDIDRFVLRRLEDEGLVPSESANAYTLVRRLALDLTGLPPDPDQADAFAANPTSEAYHSLVEALLASTAYGERWARLWLDLARYADSKGYEKDSGRSIWSFRDWVIRAFNDDLPFDRFTIEQLAGDLLPNPTEGQRIATAFHRNTMTNDEGGTDDEEFRCAAVIDRVNTTMQVWMGLTVGCAQCHSHKYDPISHQEYYQLFDFFNHTEDADRPNEQPTLATPSAEQRHEVKELETRLAGTRKTLEGLETDLLNAESLWERSASERATEPVTEGLIGHWELEGHFADTSGGYRHGKLHDGEALFEEGIHGKAARFDAKRYVNLGDLGDFDRSDAFSYAMWIFLDRNETNVPIARMDNTNNYRGWNTFIHERRIYIHLIHDWPSNTALTVTRRLLDLKRWHHVLVTVDGSGKGAGTKIYVDGALEETDITHDTLTGTLRTDKPLYLGRRYGERYFRGSVDDVRLYDRVLDGAEARRLAQAGVDSVIAAAKKAEHWKKLMRGFYRAHHAPPQWRQAATELTSLTDQVRKKRQAWPTTPILRELPPKKRRKTNIFERGFFLNKGPEVTAAVPATFHSLPPDAPRNRLGLARWLVDERNPLTARVIVNRIWEQLFGVGFVETSENFGIQGSLPEYRELLDNLSIDFMENGWSLKWLLREIVTSSTYRQSSRVSPSLAARDPRNRLLARGARFRLEAEMIRDQALAVSGLLNRKLYGPPVFPPQPDGIWQVVYDGTPWRTSKGGDQHRRALYTYWRRTSPYPSMTTFDSPSREICVARRLRTNTPLQALVTLNDPVYLEAAQSLARKLTTTAGSTAESTKPESIVSDALRTCLVRPPRPGEVKLLVDLYHSELAHYRAHEKAAIDMVSKPLGRSLDGVDPAELAAWTVVSNVILNLDELLTRG